MAIITQTHIHFVVVVVAAEEAQNKSERKTLSNF